MWFKNQGFVPDDGQRGSQFNPSGTIPFPERKKLIHKLFVSFHFSSELQANHKVCKTVRNQKHKVGSE